MNSRVVSKQYLLIYVHISYTQIFHANKEHASWTCQANFVGSELPHPRRSASSALSVARHSLIASSDRLTFLALQAQSPARGGLWRNVIEQRSLRLNQNSHAEVCLSSPPPVTHGRQFYIQPIVLNRRGTRGKDIGAHLMDASLWFNLSLQ